MYEQIRDEELDKLGGKDAHRYADATEILDALVLSDDFTEFLTLRAYDYI